MVYVLLLVSETNLKVATLKSQAAFLLGCGQSKIVNLKSKID